MSEKVSIPYGKYRYIVTIERYFGPPVEITIRANDGFDAIDRAKNSDTARSISGKTIGPVCVKKIRG